VGAYPTCFQRRLEIKRGGVSEKKRAWSLFFPVLLEQESLESLESFLSGPFRTGEPGVSITG